jgi:DNA-binding transcriptional LysR family regulator
VVASPLLQRRSALCFNPRLCGIAAGAKTPLRAEEELDRFHLINVFVAVVDAQGLAGAARKLNLSPPAVTRAINELETELGVRLLTRTTRYVRVTEAGARYAEDCRGVLAQLAEADASAAGQQRTPRGHLTVTAPVLFGARYVAPVVTEYLQRHPDVVATCWFLDRVVNLVDEGADVGVRIGDLPDSSMQATAVGRVRRLVCAAPAYLQRCGTPRTPADLQGHVVVASSAVTPTTDWKFFEDGEPLTVKLRPRLTTTSNDAALVAALGGFGITRLLSYQVADALHDGRLVTVLDAYAPPPLPVHVVHREGQHASAKARAFLDLVVERLRANPSLQSPGAA